MESRTDSPIDGELTVIRYITTGVIMNREVAKRIYDFIGRHMQNLEARDEAKEAVSAAKSEKGTPKGASAFYRAWASNLRRPRP